MGRVSQNNIGNLEPETGHLEPENLNLNLSPRSFLTCDLNLTSEPPIVRADQRKHAVPTHGKDEVLWPKPEAQVR